MRFSDGEGVWAHPSCHRAPYKGERSVLHDFWVYHSPQQRSEFLHRFKIYLSFLALSATSSIFAAISSSIRLRRPYFISLFLTETLTSLEKPSFLIQAPRALFVIFPVPASFLRTSVTTLSLRKGLLKLFHRHFRAPSSVCGHEPGGSV